VTFNGGNLLRRSSWTGTPAGTDQAFSVFAVVRSAAAQNASIVAFWPDAGSGIGSARCSVLNSSGNTFFNLARDDDAWGTQSLSSSADAGTGRHVVAWRFIPGTTDVMKITVDQTTYTNDSLTSLGQLSVDKLLVGSRSDYTWLFNGDISELVVVPSTVSDSDVANFRNYAQCEWGGLPGPDCND
jgi:hypothetical protein